MSYELTIKLDGSLLCNKCGSTITVKTGEVFEVHNTKCEEWVKMRDNL